MNLDFLSNPEIKNGLCLQETLECELYACKYLKSRKMEDEIKLLHKLDNYYVKHIRCEIEKVILNDNKIKLNKIGLINSCSHVDIESSILCDYLEKKGFKIIDQKGFFVVSWESPVIPETIIN